jgi:hypothetical protein
MPLAESDLGVLRAVAQAADRPLAGVDRVRGRRGAAHRAVLGPSLRERGNVYVEHERGGLPPVLAFEHELILDGRHAAQARLTTRCCGSSPIRPRANDPKKRPFVVVDPRAGHGPGIRRLQARQPDRAWRSRGGHPCYFFSFFPEPVPRQSLLSVAEAEAAFLAKIAELHPDADGKPS